MKSQTIISGNLFILPFLTGLTLMTTACFTIVTHDARRPSQNTNFIPQDTGVANNSTVSEPPTPDQDSGHTYHLELIAEPSNAAEFEVAPSPDDRDAYPAGTTVTIDVLHHPGWEIEQWDGPVFAVSGNVAKVNMERDQTVWVRMVKADPIVAPAGTSRPASADSP